MIIKYNNQQLFDYSCVQVKKYLLFKWILTKQDFCLLFYNKYFLLGSNETILK